MTRDTIEGILGELGILYGYGDIENPMTPYAAYYIGDTVITCSDTYPASGATVRADDVTVELYTTGKDWELEDRLEAMIERYSPRKHEERNYYESVYQITYTFTITEKRRRT